MHNSSLFSSPLGFALLFAMVIVGAYFGATLIAAFALLILLLCLSARLWSRNVLQKTHVSIDDGQTACHAGDTLSLTLRVHSQSVFPLIWLDVFLPLGQELILHREDDEEPQPLTLPMEKPHYGLSERFAWLLWQHEIACEETLLALHRGVALIDRASLQAGDGLGMAANQQFKPLEKPVRLCVYPRLVHVDIRPFTRLISDAETGPKGQTEDVTLLKSSRPYQHGDPVKRINWRHLALSGRMETNQYETITPGCITFVLDLASFRYFKTVVTRYDMRETLPFVLHERLEQMISLVASCIQALCEQGLRFALIIPGHGAADPVVCRPGSGDTALYQAMEALAELDYSGQDTRLPADEIRRLRRQLGVLHLCSLTDLPTLKETLEALSCERLRVVACLRNADASRAGELSATLLSDLTQDFSAESTPESSPQEGGAA